MWKWTEIVSLNPAARSHVTAEKNIPIASQKIESNPSDSRPEWSVSWPKPIIESQFRFVDWK
jgi:hypothetical protein